MKRIDEESFISAYDDYADALFRYAYFRVYDRERAKEIMQEAFLKTWEYLASGKKITNVRAFLYRTVHNLSVNEAVRHKAYSLEEMQEVAGFDPAETKEATPEEAAEYQLVLAALEKLEEAERDVIVMRYVDGLPVQEIAHILKEAPNTVSVRIHRALQKVRDQLQP
ncbi:MAG TPA: RNA polymerase sigma factor [Candidatus Paceibacterota bacterium]|nr:RNA polymerase sigma factor [Candidatus Paceibacterota bacterium]